MAAGNPVAVEIKWVANPFRGERFEEVWTPAAEAVMHYGATAWAFLRDKDGLLDFTQWALFPTKLDFERYWYSEEISTAREESSGLFQVPVLPTYHELLGAGAGADAPTAASPS
jgi:hypothetical protein